MRFLRFMPRYSVFKKVRVGFTLLKSSFKSLFFGHRHYFFLNFALTVIQFLHLNITGLVHHRLTPGVLITELLAGENFFEMLWHDAHFTASISTFFPLLTFIIFLYLAIILMLFVLSAAAHYTQENNSLLKSMQISLSHWRVIGAWGLVELCVQGTSSLVGDIGALLYFAWNIITIFDVQIISFDRVSATYVLKKSWQLFTQNYGEVVALDVIIEGLLIMAGFLLYTISRHALFESSMIGSENYNGLIIFFMVYLISTVMIFETVVFTNLYKQLKTH